VIDRMEHPNIDEGSVAIDPTSAADACNILTTTKSTP